MSAEKPRRLGRGLEALIGGGSAPAPSELQRIALSRIRPNPYQPRREFHPEELADLEASIKASGLLQPITVRRAGDAFEIIAGERRFRAVTNLGWTDVQAIVREFDDQTMLVLALVENLQRADLNAIDEARGYRRLADEFRYTQQQIADAIGKDRATVANLLRLLSLPTAVQRMVEEGLLTAGHARAVLGVGGEAEQIALAQEVVARGLTVRDVEQRTKSGVKRLEKGLATQPTPLEQPPADPAVRAVQDQLRRHLQTDVQVVLSGANKGSVRISFYSVEDFERLTDLLLGGNRADY